jgi:hypothetical protein
LISKGNKTSVSCPSTGTALTVPAAWQPRLERLSDSVAVLECRECGGVLEVVAAKREVDFREALSRLGVLHERLTGRQLGDITVSGARTDGGHAEIHYMDGVVSEVSPPRETFVLSGLVAQRDGASCSILVVETEAAWKNRSALSPLLKGVVDSPWRDVREHEEGRSNAAEFLRLLLTVGAYSVKAVPH